MNPNENKASNTSNPSKTSGKYHSVVGGLKETIGQTIGSPSMQQKGVQERAAGQAEYHAASGDSNDARGTKERIAGKKDQLMGSGTGDRTQQS